MKLKKVKIGEIGQIITGNTPPRKNEDYFGSAYPWIKPTDIEIDYRFVEQPEEYYSKLAFKKYKNALLPPGATCVVTIGTVGQKLCLTKEKSFTNQSINAIIPNQDYYDNDFVFYLMKYSLPKVSKANPGTASGRHHVSKSNFSNIEVDVPPKSAQQKIASILSAFDDLIENNTRRIAILEEMVRLIYREWFVHYRYPGNENDCLVDSGTDQGEVPEGWKVKEVDVVVNRLSKGNIYRKKNIDNKGEVIVIDQSTDDYLGFHNNEPDFNASFDEPFIVFGDHTCKIEMLTRPFSLGPNVVPFIPKNEELSTYYLYWLVEGVIESREYKRHWSSFKVKKVVLAPIELSNLFEREVKPVYRQIGVLKEKIRKLKETRDLLLPKLISGKVGV